MTKKVDTWMPLLIDKYLGDTTDLTTEQHGAYMLLLMAMWKKDGTLPNDDQRLASITRLPASRWRASKGVLMEFFQTTEDGQGITQKRLSAELLRSKAATDAKAEAGAKGAAKRWQKGAPDGGGGNGTANSTAIAQPSGSQWQTGASIHTPSATQIPDKASALSSLAGLSNGEATPTARGAVGQALKRAGVDLTRINLSDPRITSLIEQGATPDEFEGIAREAVEKGIASPVGWICTALAGRRSQAAGITLAPPPAADDPWSTRAGVDGIAKRVGLKPWDECCHWPEFVASVRQAAERQGVSA